VGCDGEGVRSAPSNASGASGAREGAREEGGGGGPWAPLPLYPRSSSQTACHRSQVTSHKSRAVHSSQPIHNRTVLRCDGEGIYFLKRGTPLVLGRAVQPGRREREGHGEVGETTAARLTPKRGVVLPMRNMTAEDAAEGAPFCAR